MRRRRVALGRSQEEIALDAGIERAHYSGIERGEQNPSYSTLVAIAKVLGVPLWQLEKEASRK